MSLPARRQVLQAGAALLLMLRAPAAWAAAIVAVRVWPADDYTRVTIESDAALTTRHTFVASPPRLAVDIEGLAIYPALRELVAAVRPDDPFISGVRVGQYSPTVVRLVIDLRQPVLPQVFSLTPIAAYGHRLVFDLYPTQTADPLQALISERRTDLQRREGAAQAARGATAPASAASVPSAQAAALGEPTLPPSDDPLGALIEQQTQRSAGAAQPARVAASAASGPAAPAASSSITPPGNAPASTAATGTNSTRPVTRSGPTDRLIIVTLDAGHGGEDPGAIGPSGTREKDIVLKMARLLRERINATSINGQPMRAHLTRDGDFFVPLQVRVDKARRVQADLFVSLHADAFFTPKARGASVFALSQGAASSSAARWMANKENRADLIGGLNVRAKDAQVTRALLDMSTTAQINDSLKLGSALLREIGKVGRLHKPRVEQAGFAVLKAPEIPSVLVETAFISNPEEEARLRSETYREQLADAIMKGIRAYFARNPPLARSRST